MLVAFETKSYSRVVFFGDVARDLLLAMGKSGDVPGALRANEVPEATARLTKFLMGADGDGNGDGASDADAGAEDAEPRIDLSTRAYPLLRLLESASANQDDVIWKKA